MRGSQTPTRGFPRRGNTLLGAVVVLVALGLAAFLPLFDNGFLEYDDHLYITRNQEVLRGLTWEGVRWAFGATAAGNWHPLTWISHMADVTAFGLDPRGHHLVNLLLHLGSCVLLFAVLRAMTGRAAPSFFAAALLAVHPLRVESVAWAAERKDALSVFFWMAAMAAYLAYARSGRPRAYAATLAMFALGLLSKPMVVTLPFALLLLDYWPLGRLRARFHPAPGVPSAPPVPWRRLALEKTPFFALAALSSAVTVLAQRGEGYARTRELYPFAARLANAAVSYLVYLRKTLWPESLAVFYPHPRDTLAAWEGIAAAVLLLAATALLLRGSRRRPYLLVGWLWFLGTLVPVIGLVQVGSQALADRYTYLPHVGVFVMACWLAADMPARHVKIASLLGAAGAFALVAFAAQTRRQTGTWRDTITLFGHAAKVTRDNWQAHLMLWAAYQEKGDTAEAERHYAELRRLRPERGAGGGAREKEIAATPGAGGGHAQFHALASPEALDLFREAQALQEQGRVDAAAARLAASLERSPDFTEARSALADLLSRKGATREAAAQYRELLRRKPDHAEAHINLAVELYQQGNLAESETHLKEAIHLDGSLTEAHYNLGLLYARSGRYADAAREYRAVLQLDPRHDAARRQLRALEPAAK
jgi:tetratricopeptide (TPR) repeat protein